jgi:hypothetical protein
MKKLIKICNCVCILIGVLIATTSAAQHSDTTTADNVLLKNGLQLSSVGIVNGKVYSIEEKLHKFMVLDPGTLEVIDEEPGLSKLLETGS